MLNLRLSDVFYSKNSANKGLELLFGLEKGEGIYFHSNNFEIISDSQIDKILDSSFEKTKHSEIVNKDVVGIFEIEGVGFYLVLSDEIIFNVFEEPGDVYGNFFTMDFEVISKSKKQGEFLELIDDINSMGKQLSVQRSSENPTDK